MAEYTKLDFNDLQELTAPYPIGKLRDATPMEGGQANSSYRLSTDKGKFILAVCDQKDHGQIQSLIRVLNCLASHKFPTSRVVADRDGNHVTTFNGHPVYIKNYIEGELVRELNTKKIFNIGKAMARLHDIPAPQDTPDSFPFGMAFFEELYQTGSTHPYLDWLKEKQDFITGAIDPAMSKGLVHGDIFWDNLLFTGNDLAAVLDFEEACREFRLFDIGMAAVGCCAKQGRFDMEKTAALVAGYRHQTPFTAHEKKQLKVFMVYAAAAGSSWRFNQYNIKYPGHDLAQSYMELSALADHVYAMDETSFLQSL